MTTPRPVIDALFDAREPLVLATVVRITGSSYGGVGTRMIIRPDGSTVGIVSGGCLEADLAEHARDVRITGVAKVVTYDTREDDDAAWGLGLGCNGIIDVLLEPLHGRDARSVADLLESARNAAEPAVLATIVANGRDAHAPIGSHVLITPSGADSTKPLEAALVDSIVRDAPKAFSEKRRGMIREYDRVSVAFEVITPAIRLIVCGSGPDVVPLVRFGVELGWNLTVVDHRAIEIAHPERFPGAHVVECREPAHLAKSTALTSATASIVMSHHYARDLEYMKALLASDVRYIGLLGPRARTERMLAEITSSGELVDIGNRLFAPVGLDTGGDGPASIALAIIAEVSAVMLGSSAGHLRDRGGGLHESEAAGTASAP